MKKITLLLAVAFTMFSCDGLKKMNTSNVASAAQLLGSMSSNSTVQQISSLFSLLDTNNDEAISTTEAIGKVSQNFNVLDTNNNSSLNLTELTGLLGLLK
ncbi:Ca2+-binding EF-hand superfamily protein [Wenyingzhuangia heitensis]|uniref:Ca2+-binding EF-hand superfamily protein n=1 Tax=Wenyingzhuangia heitensis TaxID=1487859 RepID=A0ABX0U7J2_9FLAO|nr:hypothetical protein [Wenyingzhuangia heitensis]NIJ44804.1 Ca2+-binding EF-hand superfamily protein [Wenyingzhuangia heitensis]